MTKFFKTLEELKDSLPTSVNLWPKGSFDAIINNTPGFIWGAIESPKTAIVINGGNLEKYLYTGNLRLNDFAWSKSISYDFKLLDICPISEYNSLIESKETFESNLPKQYLREFSLIDSISGSDIKKQGAFFAQKTAIVIDGDKFQEILYTPMPGECTKEGWFASSTLEVNYKSEVLNEIAIDEVLADFAM